MATTTIFPVAQHPPSLPRLTTGEATSKPDQTPANPLLANPDYRLLSQDEWVQFCHGIGVMNGEGGDVIRPTCWYWPARGFPDGLYQDTLWEKAKFAYWFHIFSAIRCLLLVVQLALSATLTALGSLSLYDGTAITVIGAVNTCMAGILALMHNSGLPDRYRSDRNE